MKSQANALPGKGAQTAAKGGSKKEEQPKTDDFDVIEDFEVIEEGESAPDFEVLEEVESLEEVEELDEVELVEEEDEEPRPRPKKGAGKGRKRRRRDEEEEEEEDDAEAFFTRNRITGIVGLVIGPAFLVFGIVWQFNNEFDLMLRIIIMILGGLITLAGLFYVIKG
jgi:hypothetical protein